MKIICALNKNLFFFIQGYSFIGKGFCDHVSGEDPFECYRAHYENYTLSIDVLSQSLCEDNCTSWTSCIAYYYGRINNIKGHEYCCLIPSERSCPSGFSTASKSGSIAASMNDLKADDLWGYFSFLDCYGKN